MARSPACDGHVGHLLRRDVGGRGAAGYFASPTILGWMGTPGEARDVFLPPGSDALPVAVHINERVLWSFVLFSITFILTGVVRATGAVWAPLQILVFSMYVIRIPFASLLQAQWGPEAIWWSFPLGTVTSAALTCVYYMKADWRRSNMVDPPQPAGHAADTDMATPSVAVAESG